MVLREGMGNTKREETLWEESTSFVMAKSWCDKHMVSKDGAEENSKQ